ncbi:FkbM family methyltransferase [Shinella sp. S4-D37]|uniref:FkbM family methyltransferase n=1 Tax=Shinella sp. S4-D37 TaxID=3161999 RepID=UPI003466102C
MSDIIDHFGIRLRIDREFMSPKLIEALRNGQYETSEARKIGNIIQPGDVVLEIGAGIGFMTALMLKNPATARVVSFEANPLLISKIQRTLDDNNLGGQRFELHNNILGAKDIGTVDFHIHKDFWASSLRKTPGTIRSCPVPLASFDKTIKAIRPDVIVCDIEGGERALFPTSDLVGVRNVYTELHQRVLGPEGMRDVFQTFHDRGFHYDQNHSRGAIVLFSKIPESAN